LYDGDEVRLEGRRFELDSSEDVDDVLRQAFDYRGDVTIERRDGSSTVGYLSNLRLDADEPWIEIWPRTDDRPTRVSVATLKSIAFTGADPAAGKSWQAWLERVAEAERKGEIAELYPESIDG
jgi:hypothetical protein